MSNPFFVHESAIIDDNVVIDSDTKIWHFSHIQSNSRIGNHVKIQNNVSVYEGVELEDYVFCGPSMVFTNIMYPRCKYPQRGSKFYQKTLVKEGASIGANATIICGNTIGKSAFIGAGAVVGNDIPDYALVVGNPAKQIGWICECGHKLNEKLNCSYCTTKYGQNKHGLEILNE